jgi:serine/threonine protein kinase
VQGLAGLDFLHACHQIHRDVKPANLLINLNGDVKVSDLGILRQIDIDKDIREESKSTPSKEDMIGQTESNEQKGEGNEKQINPGMHRAKTFVGTTTYMSPERIDGQDYSYPCDVWSFGLSLLTLALGRLPQDTKGGFWGILQSIRDSPPPTLPADGESERERERESEREREGERLLCTLRYHVLSCHVICILYINSLFVD